MLRPVRKTGYNAAESVLERKIMLLEASAIAPSVTSALRPLCKIFALSIAPNVEGSMGSLFFCYYAETVRARTYHFIMPTVKKKGLSAVNGTT